MFEVDNVDNKNKVLCGVYRISNDDYNMIFKKFDNHEKRIDKLADMKKKFLDWNENEDIESAIKIVFTKCLPYELEIDKDMALFTIDDFKGLFDIFNKEGVFTSVSTKMYYYNVISKYTKWAYKNEYRNDYYVPEDLTSFSKGLVIQSKNEVYTVGEMQTIIDSCDRIDVKIAIQCMLEGLKSKDVLDLKREQFEHLFNTPVQLESGIEFKMSDKLYKWCREYSNQTEIDVLFQYKHKNNITTKPLKDTPYLFRNAVKSLDIDNTQMPASSLATTVRKELDNIGINIELRTFRQYAMYYYTIKNGVAFTNKMFNSKYPHEKNVLTNAEIVKRMKEKIKAEDSENNGC